MIPSSSSMLSRDKRLPFDKWTALELQEDIFGNQCSTLGSPKEFFMVRHQVTSHMKREERQNQFHEQQGQGPLSQEMTSKVEAQFQCRCLREGLRP